MRAWAIAVVAIIFIVVISILLLYWFNTSVSQTGGQLFFSPSGVVVEPGGSTSVWLSYRPGGYTSSITVTITANTPYITVTPSTVTLNPGESTMIRVYVSNTITPGTYFVEATGDGITAVLTIAVPIAPGAGTPAETLTYSEPPIAWKIVSGSLVHVYQRVYNPSPYSDLVYRGKVKVGSTVELYVKLYPSDGDYWIGNLKIEIRADVPGRPDYTVEEHIAENIYVDGKGWTKLPITFTVPQATGVGWWCYVNPFGSCIRQYFFKIWYWRQNHWELLYDPTDPNTRPSIEAEN